MKIKKSILIIGGTGFLGFSLAKQCIRKNFSTLVFQNLNQIKIENYLK